MEILTVLIPFLIGYTFTLAEGSKCNSTIPHGRVYPYSCGNILNLQKCPYTCDPGYDKNRLSTWLSCDRYRGRWILYNPLNVLLPDFRKLKEEVLCSPQCPYRIPNGRISVFCGLHVGSKCGVQCFDGYVATNNSLQVTCLSSGQWNLNPANLCQRRVQCPVIYKDGSIDYSCDGYSGSTCLYTCNQGFTSYQDQVLVTCLDNGKWNIDPNGYCVKGVKDSVPSFSEPSVQTSSSIIVPVTLAIAAVTTIIVGVVIICFRSKYRTRRRCQSRATRTGSNRHIPMMYSVGQCRISSNLNLRTDSQTSFHAHDISPPPYTEVMKNNSANRDPPPSYEEVNACPSNFMTDTHI